MPYQWLYNLLPEIAVRETRTITVLPGSNTELAPAQYSFIEMFCDESGCDCRRVMFDVISSISGRSEAVIAWGWESREFYAKWYRHELTPEDLDELQGPAINFTAPQSRQAPGILQLLRGVLLKDAAYVDRVKRHYALFRQKVEELSRKPAPARHRMAPAPKRRKPHKSK